MKTREKKRLAASAGETAERTARRGLDAIDTVQDRLGDVAHDARSTGAKALGTAARRADDLAEAAARRVDRVRDELDDADLPRARSGVARVLTLLAAGGGVVALVRWWQARREGDEADDATRARPTASASRPAEPKEREPVTVPVRDDLDDDDVLEVTGPDDPPTTDELRTPPGEEA